MSQEKVEIVRAALNAFNRRDWDALLEHAAPSFEYDLSRAVGPWRGVYRRGQVLSVVSDLVENWEWIQFEPNELIEVGDDVVVPWTMRGGGRDGIELEARATFVWTIRDGAVERICLYQERQEALEAAGLKE
jgi:ketosteroid isomerase-like protein